MCAVCLNVKNRGTFCSLGCSMSAPLSLHLTSSGSVAELGGSALTYRYWRRHTLANAFAALSVLLGSSWLVPVMLTIHHSGVRYTTLSWWDNRDSNSAQRHYQCCQGHPPVLSQDLYDIIVLLRCTPLFTPVVLHAKCVSLRVTVRADDPKVRTFLVSLVAIDVIDL